MEITPILLCGGSGTRLWPVSRRSYPKQFAPLLGPESLFQTTVRRVSGDGFAAPVIVTAEPFRFIVAEQLAQIERAASGLLLEPDPRNTAPAILAAALLVARTQPDALLLVAPSDHMIGDTESFQATIRKGLAAAEAGQIVTFGVPPTAPETGFGYLEIAPDADLASAEALPLKRFTEKPDPETAEQMVATGHFLWNAGLFLARADVLIGAFEAAAPEVIAPVTAALEAAEEDLGFTRLAEKPWAAVPDISIDYAVMEKAPNLSVVPFDGSWSDLGGWRSVWAEAGADAAGNVVGDQATAIDCTDTLLRAEGEGMEIVGIGLEGIVAVAMPDAVLVAQKSRGQDVKTAVAALKAKGAPQATEFPRVHRPWGWFDTLVAGPRFKVKRITVHPGGVMSLQSHHHRAEHWIVVEGTAEVTVGDETKLISENESIYVPIGAKHRLRNPGKLPVVLIEVQTGGYLGEDDITRYEDAYSRR